MNISQRVYEIYTLRRNKIIPTIVVSTTMFVNWWKRKWNREISKYDHGNKYDINRSWNSRVL